MLAERPDASALRRRADKAASCTSAFDWLGGGGGGGGAGILGAFGIKKPIRCFLVATGSCIYTTVLHKKNLNASVQVKFGVTGRVNMLRQNFIV
jgi:hypothetical protein